MINVSLFMEDDIFWNVAGLEVIVYYDKIKNTLTTRSISCRKIPAHLVETPYRDSFNGAVWRRFYEILSEDELALVQSFKQRHGFFGFLHETGLYGAYETAYRYAAERVIEEWLQENKISLSA